MSNTFCRKPWGLLRRPPAHRTPLLAGRAGLAGKAGIHEEMWACWPLLYMWHNKDNSVFPSGVLRPRKLRKVHIVDWMYKQEEFVQDQCVCHCQPLFSFQLRFFNTLHLVLNNKFEHVVNLMWVLNYFLNSSERHNARIKLLNYLSKFVSQHKAL